MNTVIVIPLERHPIAGWHFFLNVFSKNCLSQSVVCTVIFFVHADNLFTFQIIAVDFINEKDIKLHDFVWIQRSGEVIPYITSVIKERRS